MHEKIPASDRDLFGPNHNVEDELFGKWFPRIGAFAVLVGAGFGFKYAVDQGLVGPRLRIMLGILLSSLLIGIGDWTRKRDWSAYAHAITGGGVGILYLTLWAAVGMYGLLPPSVGFLCLIGVSGLGCALALRHESQTLALLAVIGGFINPFVTGAGAEMPQGLYLYILSVDVGVVLLTFVRPWNVLEKVAFVASWIVLEIGGGSAVTSLLAATGIFLMFGAVPYVRVLLGKGQGVTDLALIPVNGLLYYFVVFARATGDLEVLRGPLTLGLAIFFFVGMLIARGHEPEEGVVTASSGAMSFLFVTLWVPVQMGVELMALGWSIEALALLSFALIAKEERFSWGGAIALAMALLTQLTIVATSPDSALNEHYGRFVFVIAIASMYLGAYLEHREGSHELRNAGVIAANVLTILWLSLEVYSAVRYGVAHPRPEDLQFGLSGVWALYAAGLLGAGIYLRARQVRIMSLVLFAITLTKMALHDLWLLDTLQRLIGFVGIGVLLLASSLLYHRFRNWIVSGNAVAGDRR